jgi:hypothetical protein
VLRLLPMRNQLDHIFAQLQAICLSIMILIVDRAVKAIRAP